MPLFCFTHSVRASVLSSSVCAFPFHIVFWLPFHIVLASVSHCSFFPFNCKLRASCVVCVCVVCGCVRCVTDVLYNTYIFFCDACLYIVYV